MARIKDNAPQGTDCYFSTAIYVDGKVRDMKTGKEWDSVDAWHIERCGRAATLTYQWPCSPELLAASAKMRQ